jgi:hypothetical protein
VVLRAAEAAPRDSVLRRDLQSLVGRFHRALRVAVLGAEHIVEEGGARPVNGRGVSRRADFQGLVEIGERFLPLPEPGVVVRPID